LLLIDAPLSKGCRLPESTETVLLVEDRAELRTMLTKALERMGYEVAGAATAAEALSLLARRRFSLVLTDLKLPGASGMQVLQAAQQTDPALPVIIMTAYGSIADAVAAMRDGAYDFIQKPIDLDHLQHLLARAQERQQLLRENIVLREEYARRFGFPRIVGEHPSLQQAAAEMQRAAASDSTVLLLGESGTGKELFARAIHQLSPRAARSFLALNCAAIPETLVENELFGHERGAFTGANARQTGKFELAQGGTVFLDEIGELPLAVQGKLLRVLEERVVHRLGGPAPIPVDVRLIAATNCDLQAAVEAGAFRRDLYYRLAVVPIRIPALRERGEDVLLIAEHLLERFRGEMRKPRLQLAPDAVAALRSHSWPGNVRELQNALERAALLNQGEIHASDLGLAANVRAAAAANVGVNLGGTLPDISAEAVRNVERAKIEATLRECRWNKAAAAEVLGISYKTLLNKIHAYGLD
jgi:DNA-binding NtrC family response regulator